MLLLALLIVWQAFPYVSGYVLATTRVKGIAQPVTTIVTGDPEHLIRINVILKPSETIPISYADGRVEEEIPPSVVAKYVLQYLQQAIMDAYNARDQGQVSRLLQLQSDWSQFLTNQMGREIGFHDYETLISDLVSSPDYTTTTIQEATRTTRKTAETTMATSDTTTTPTITMSNLISVTSSLKTTTTPPVVVTLTTWQQYSVWLYLAIAFDMVMIYVLWRLVRSHICNANTASSRWSLYSCSTHSI